MIYKESITDRSGANIVIRTTFLYATLISNIKIYIFYVKTFINIYVKYILLLNKKLVLLNNNHDTHINEHKRSCCGACNECPLCLNAPNDISIGPPMFNGETSKF